MASKNEYLANADDDFIECRAFRHQWNRVGTYYEGGEYQHVLQCSRCDSYALLEWASHGGQYARRMIYTDGYLNKTGDHFERDDLRAETNKRSKIKGGTKEFDRFVEKLTGEKYR